MCVDVIVCVYRALFARVADCATPGVLEVVIATYYILCHAAKTCVPSQPYQAAL